MEFTINDLIEELNNETHTKDARIDFDDIVNMINHRIYEKYCMGCHKEKYCHEHCVRCDEMEKLINDIGGNW